MITFRPATRPNQPLLIGLAGPSKSGKSKSALRLAVGLAGGREIFLLNTEPHGNHYADQYTYQSADIEPPHRVEKYIEALEVVAPIRPGVLIIDTLTHMHDGIGGMNEWHDELALQMAKGDESRAEKMNAPAWAEVKAAENHFVYQLQAMQCHVILTFRAKEKMKIQKDGKWIDLGWRPIMSDRISFETLFTLMFPPFAKGVPDLAISDLREPFDTLIPKGRPLDEDLGRRLAEWAGSSNDKSTGSRPEMGGSSPSPARTPVDEWSDQLDNVKTVPQRAACWERLKADWGTFVGAEQKRLLVANERAKARVGG